MYLVMIKEKFPPRWQLLVPRRALKAISTLIILEKNELGLHILWKETFSAWIQHLSFFKIQFPWLFDVTFIGGGRGRTDIGSLPLCLLQPRLGWIQDGSQKWTQSRAAIQVTGAKYSSQRLVPESVCFRQNLELRGKNGAWTQRLSRATQTP